MEVHYRYRHINQERTEGSKQCTVTGDVTTVQVQAIAVVPPIRVNQLKIAVAIECDVFVVVIAESTPRCRRDPD